MHSMRYSNDVDVQGWEPSLDGGADLSLDAFGLPPTSNYPSTTTNTNTTMTTTMRRQAPPTRARAATCPNIHDFSFMPRSGPDSRHGSTAQPTNDGQAPGPSSTRNAAAAGRSGSRPRSSTERKIARKLAENANYVPRPKNSFILFRTEFVAQRTNGGSDGSKRSSSATRSHGSSSVKSDDDDDEATSASLSKQASEVWNKMTEEDKRPYMERAKLEKAAHEAKYPNYRYKPVRHNPARKNGPPPASGRTQSPFPNPVAGLQCRTSEPMATQAMDGHSNEYQTTVPTSSLHMPAPVPRRLSVSSMSPSSSVSRSSTPAVQESQSSTTGSSSGLSLPTVPRVPTLTFNTEQGPSRATVFPPIPRSPSAPIFDRHVINQFPPPHQQHHLVPPMPGTFQPHHVSGSFADVRRTADPSSSNAASSGLTQITSPVSAATSDVAMHSSLPTPESSEPDYFRDFIRCDQDDMTAGPTPTTASSAFTSPRMFTTSNEIYNEKNNDNGIFDGTHSSNTHSHHEIELDQMDIDMRALLNLSPVPEVAESAPTAPTSTNENVQRPFEAIAALWVQDQQLLAQQQQNLDGGSGAAELAPPIQSQVQNFSQPQTQTQTQTQDSPKRFATTYSSTNSKSSGSTISGSSVVTSTDTMDSGLDPFHTHIPNPSIGSSLEEDLFRLDLEFIPPASRFSCATSPSLSGFGSGSGLGLGGLDDTLMGLPDSGMGDAFGYDRYDRERGLYGIGSGSPGAPVAGGAGGFGSGFGFGFGLDYGF